MARAPLTGRCTRCSGRLLPTDDVIKTRKNGTQHYDEDVCETLGKDRDRNYPTGDYGPRLPKRNAA